jgi:hypothetical protein
MEFDRSTAFPTPQDPGAPPHEPAPEAPRPVAPGTTFGRAVLASLVWVGVALVLMFAIQGASVSGYGLGYFVGRAIPVSLISAWLVHRFFRHKRLAFGWLVAASLPTFFVSFVVISAIVLVGRS